ncbi:hypothetical protein ANO14919_144920 [Xylariales sp. No.14919]|nr:hypothetical protein ANO14919_144920 [Xylariales sp. No.14919]
MPRPKLQHTSPSAGAPLSSECLIQPRQKLRSSPPSQRVTSSLLGAKTQCVYTPCVHGPRSPPSSRDTGSLAQSSQLPKNDTERMSRISTAESQHHSHQLVSATRKEQQTFRRPRTRDILKHPQLQKVTGVLPRKVDLWDDRELPPDEIYRLAWAMTLPEPFPVKRPRGERLTQIAPQVKKT